MAGKNNGLDAIMAMMALKTLMNDTKDWKRQQIRR